MIECGCHAGETSFQTNWHQARTASTDKSPHFHGRNGDDAFSIFQPSPPTVHRTTHSWVGTSHRHVPIPSQHAPRVHREVDYAAEWWTFSRMFLNDSGEFPSNGGMDSHNQTSVKSVEIVIWTRNPNSSIFPNRNRNLTRNPRVLPLAQRGGLRLRLRLRERNWSGSSLRLKRVVLLSSDNARPDALTLQNGPTSISCRFSDRASSFA